MIDDILLEAEDRMDKTVAATRDDFSSIRTGRATPGMFAKVLVDYYGAPTPVNQLASIQVPEPRMALLNPYDKSTLNAIERAVRDSDLGVNPGNDGNVIRCSFPQLTEDRRRDLVKVARAKAEDGKVSLRNIRRKAKDDLDKLGKDGDVGEDEVRRAEKDLDEVTSSHVNKVDAALKDKESELLEI